MSWQDAINASLELGSGFMQLLSIRRLYRDKIVRGVDWKVTAFFAFWGIWNCFYYPHLGQWASFVGGLGITEANFVWVGMLLYYQGRRNRLIAGMARAWAMLGLSQDAWQSRSRSPAEPSE